MSKRDFTDINKRFSDLYEKYKDELYATDYLKELREKGFDNFKAKGIPSKEDEAYKYTDLYPVFYPEYKENISATAVDIEINEIFKCDVPELNTNFISILNGAYHGDDLKDRLPEGVIMCGLKDAIKKYPEIVEKYLGKATSENDAITDLNTALLNDGLFIYMPANTHIENPLQVVNMLVHDENLFVNQRNLIILERGSELKVVFCDHTLSLQSFLTNSVTEVFVEDNANFDFYNMQNEHNASNHLSSMYIHQSQDSTVSTNTLTLHGGLIRNNINVKMNGSGCENNTYGLYLLDKGQHVDNYSQIEHLHPDCNSNELFKGILDDYATGAFRGRVYVKQDAQRTNAFQANNNILLTNDAKINTKPQLEIYADDVKCSHGATVGQLDEDAMFYMRARGINKKEARMLLMSAFAHDIINNINIEPLKERVSDLVEKRLRGELSKCNNCVFNCC